MAASDHLKTASNYDGTPINRNHSEKEGMEQPLTLYVPFNRHQQA